MDEGRDLENLDRLTTAVERLVGIQKSVAELNQEANQIRRHMKDFDFNVDALNILATARNKDHGSSGGQLLEEVIKYARQSGTQMPVFGDDHVPPPTSDEPAPSDSRLRADEKDIEVAAVDEAKSQLLKVLGQLVVAVTVTTGLFVLIH
jgi:nicotinamide mononucleotide adenylyltransferase